MQKTASGTSASQIIYRERLSPSLWILGGAAVAGPMAALVFTPVNTTLALIIGAAVGVAVIAWLLAASPKIEVRGEIFRAGRAHINVALLGEPVELVGEPARQARGPGLARNSWHLIRGGIDGLVLVPIVDPDDPISTWVVSTRTPDRLAAALRRSQN